MFGLLLEPGTDPDSVRFVILERHDDGTTTVESVYEATDVENAWDLTREYYPGIDHVVIGADFVEVDCLSLREAVEAHYGPQLPRRKAEPKPEPVMTDISQLQRDFVAKVREHMANRNISRDEAADTIADTLKAAVKMHIGMFD